MKLGMHVGLSPGHSVLDGETAPPKGGAEPPPKFSAHVYSKMSVVRCDLIETFKIVSRKYDINPELFFQLDEGDRRGHD